MFEVKEWNDGTLMEIQRKTMKERVSDNTTELSLWVPLNWNSSLLPTHYYSSTRVFKKFADTCDFWKIKGNLHIHYVLSYAKIRHTLRLHQWGRQTRTQQSSMQDWFLESWNRNRLEQFHNNWNQCTCPRFLDIACIEIMPRWHNLSCYEIVPTYHDFRFVRFSIHLRYNHEHVYEGIERVCITLTKNIIGSCSKFKVCLNGLKEHAFHWKIL